MRYDKSLNHFELFGESAYAQRFDDSSEYVIAFKRYFESFYDSIDFGDKLVQFFAEKPCNAEVIVNCVELADKGCCVKVQGISEKVLKEIIGRKGITNG